MAYKKLKCLNCNIEFSCEIKRKNRKFCNLNCAYQYRTKPVEKECVNCLKIFTVTKSKKMKKYCSKVCWLLYKGTFINCKECQNEFWLTYGQVKKRKNLLNSKCKECKNKDYYYNNKGYAFIKPEGTLIAEHRYVMEQHIGRKLYHNENVHHINGVRNDNRIENLELWEMSQPRGQRLDEKIEFYINFLEKYGYTISKE